MGRKDALALASNTPSSRLLRTAKVLAIFICLFPADCIGFEYPTVGSASPGCCSLSRSPIRFYFTFAPRPTTRGGKRFVNIYEWDRVIAVATT